VADIRLMFTAPFDAAQYSAAEHAWRRAVQIGAPSARR